MVSMLAGDKDIRCFLVSQFCEFLLAELTLAETTSVYNNCLRMVIKLIGHWQLEEGSDEDRDFDNESMASSRTASLENLGPETVDVGDEGEEISAGRTLGPDGRVLGVVATSTTTSPSSAKDEGPSDAHTALARSPSKRYSKKQLKQLGEAVAREVCCVSGGR